jgi:hypothetical protein
MEHQSSTVPQVSGHLATLVVEALVIFVLDYPLKDIYFGNSLGR